MNMKIVILIMGLLLLGCSSAKKPEIDSANVILGPQVKQFLEKTEVNSDNKLAVTIRTKVEINDIVYLKKISQTYYTANLTIQELKQLISDERIEKISSSMKKPFK